jgi:hypothetical protein
VRNKLILFILTIPLLLIADEGMWQLSQVKSLQLQEKGLALPPDALYNADGGGLSDAILSMGGCSASFISANGLIATNHHCAYGAISRNSTPENNILANGFVARSYSEEIPTDIKLTINYRMRDVSEEIKAAAADVSDPAERFKLIEKAIKAMVIEVEKAPHTMARVASMNGGQQYMLFVSKEIRDVRLVYNPAGSIGKYGGDIDNWMWPRHTGDFSFLRAYVGADGEPADYAEDNIPYQPQRFLKVSTAGVAEGDFQMIMGFPGRTMRYRTAMEVETALNQDYRRTIEIMGQLRQIIDDARAADETVSLKYAGLSAGINNFYKNTQGMIDGLSKSQLAARKHEQEKALRAWLAADAERQERYGQPLDEINAIVAEQQKLAEKRTIARWLVFINSVLSRANTIVRWSQEKEKPELERLAGYMSRDEARQRQRLETMERTFAASVDAELLTFFLQTAFALPEDQRIAAIEKLVGSADNIDSFVKELYAKTKLTDPEQRLAYFDMSAAEIKASDDPALQLAWAMAAEADQYDAMDERQNGQLIELRPNFIEALAAMQNKPLYPDANGTLRFTYGYVRGYSPADAVQYNWYTTAAGILEKDTGEEPFNAPEKQLQLLRDESYEKYTEQATNELRVNYLNTCDITGGNSGSAVLNGKGHLVGLAFDGNYEAMTSDWQFTDALSRTIVVDIRYALWTMHYVDEASHLIDEMQLVDE